MRLFFCRQFYPLPRKGLFKTLLSMNLAIVFLLALCFNASAEAFSQRVSLSETDVPLGKVFKEITRQTGYTFIYTRSLLKKSRNVTINVQNVPIAESLDLCFESQPLTYTILNTMVIVKEKEREITSEEEVLSPPAPMAPPVTGRVTDDKGQPLEGATILVKGAQTGTNSDANGNFSINVEPNSILIISYVGFESAEVNVGNRTNISVQLKPTVATSDEVVVVGYGTQKKVNLTGAVSHVTSEVLENRPLSNVAQGLQGVIPNLNIGQSSGALGKNADFNIRGFTSINGGSPLILINGVPGDVSMLNPNDIQEVSVLKDAASAAIYGARGAFGVILITTKKGGEHNPQITLSMNYAVNKPTVFNEIMDSKERLEYYNTAMIRQSGAPYFDDVRAAAILAHYNDPSQPELVKDPPLAGYFGAANIQWPREVMKTSYPMQQYNVSVSGGSDKFKYYTSFAYLDEKGIAKGFNEYYDRYNLTSELSYKIAKWITVSSNILVNKSKKHYPPNSNVSTFGEDVNYLFSNSWTEDPIYDQEGRYYTKDGKINMVQFLREGGYRDRDISDVWVTGRLILNPVKHTTINIDYTYNNRDTEEKNYLKSLTGYNEQPIGIYQTQPNSVTRTNENYDYKAFNAYLNYENSFGLHSVKASIGFNQENSTVADFSAYREGLAINTIPFLSLATGSMTVSDGESEYALRGGFGRINYNFDDRYLLEINGRYDGTSKFPKNDRFALFPSVSVGWRIDNENFFDGLKNTFNLLKIRASYGNLGNQDVAGYYPYIATFSTNQVNYLIDNKKPLTVVAPGLVSPTLTWEVVTQKNLGLDFAVLSNRLSGSFDIYRRDTKNMLTASQPLPSVLGVAEPRTNAADLKTIGFDVSVDWKQKIPNGLVGLSLIFSDYSSEITRYSNPAGLIGSYYVGKKIGDIWGLVTDGLFQSNEEAQSVNQTAITGRKLEAGDLRFKDIDGNGKIDKGNSTLSNPGDQKIIGNSTPRYSFGFRPNIYWKGIDVTIFLQGVMKRDVNLSTTDFLYQYSSQWNAQPKIGTDYWTEDNRDAYFPAPLVTNSADVTTAQTRFLQNGAYMRLKELTIGYTLPAAVTNKIKMNKIRFYLSGYNITEITNMIRSSDPELSNGRLYPIHRSLSVGANIQF